MAEWASSEIHKREMLKLPPLKSRRKCQCGCGGRALYVGTANGLGMTRGCELYIRRWVRDGIRASKVQK